MIHMFLKNKLVNLNFAFDNIRCKDFHLMDRKKKNIFCKFQFQKNAALI
jgi:hypothetical protein